jgi:pectin methylesterase-like acyl-CoA thioesterase
LWQHQQSTICIVEKCNCKRCAHYRCCSTIVAATGSFNTFTNSAGTPSAVQTFSVSGDNLKSDVIVTAPAGYELSRDGTSWASQTIALSPTSGSLAATTVSVRLNAATAGSYNGDITVSSSDATSAALAVTGTTNPAAATPAVTASGSLTNFLHTAGRPSAAQSITVSGSNLSGNVVVTPSTPFEVSANGVNWFNHTSPLTFTNNNGGLTASNLLVRLNATSAGAYSGNVVITSTGANNVTVPASGTTNAQSTFVYSPTTADAVVAKDGSGQYATIQAAINAAPTNRTTPYIIYIKNGKYVEKVNIPSNKPNIQLIGESAANTIISWDSYSGKVENGVIIGTSTSATLTVNSNDFFMMNIMVENSSGYVGDGPQALALYIVGDRAGFKNCRFISGQDTVWHNGDGKRHYFKDCYIDGNTDFVFGSSIALFENCTIFPRDRIDGSAGGYITAANTPAGQTYGEVFRDSRITKNRGVTNYTMGRPWQNDQGKESKTVFLNTTMASSIVPAGWSVWDANTRPALITYAEYKSRKWDGDLVDVSQRVSWSKQLSDNEAAAYYANSNLFGTWDAGAQFPALLKDIPVELAISNFRAQRGAANTTLSWNISWPVGAVTYTLYRSTDNINFTKINEFTSEPESVVAFSLTDAAPAKGTLYYYYVTASKAGMASHTSYTAIVDPSIPLDGEFRSAGSGLWTNASSGNGTNTNSIWERYSASTSSWVLQAKGVQPNSVNVTVRSGHTVLLDGLKNANNLTIESGAALKGNGGYTTTPTAQTLRIGAGSAASVSIQNDGVFGGDNNPDDMIIVEFNTACASVLWTGNGTSKSLALRPLPANTNPLSVVFDQDISLSLNSGAFTAYYNSTGNTLMRVLHIPSILEKQLSLHILRLHLVQQEQVLQIQQATILIISMEP